MRIGTNLRAAVPSGQAAVRGDARHSAGSAARNVPGAAATEQRRNSLGDQWLTANQVFYRKKNIYTYIEFKVGYIFVFFRLISHVDKRNLVLILIRAAALCPFARRRDAGSSFRRDNLSL